MQAASLHQSCLAENVQNNSAKSIKKLCSLQMAKVVKIETSASRELKVSQVAVVDFNRSRQKDSSLPQRI
jgi:hypothetical protein